jgi:hypothetical protein
VKGHTWIDELCLMQQSKAQYVERRATDVLTGEQMKKCRKGESEQRLELEVASGLTHGAHANAYKKPCSHRNEVLRARRTICLLSTHTRLPSRHMKTQARPIAHTLMFFEMFFVLRISRLLEKVLQRIPYNVKGANIIQKLESTMKPSEARHKAAQVSSFPHSQEFRSLLGGAE